MYAIRSYYDLFVDNFDSFVAVEIGGGGSGDGASNIDLGNNNFTK